MAFALHRDDIRCECSGGCQQSGMHLFSWLKSTPPSGPAQHVENMENIDPDMMLSVECRPPRRRHAPPAGRRSTPPSGPVEL